MKTDDFGIPRFTNRDLIDMIYTGHIDKCHVSSIYVNVDFKNMHLFPGI